MHCHIYKSGTLSRSKSPHPTEQSKKEVAKSRVVKGQEKCKSKSPRKNGNEGYEKGLLARSKEREEGEGCNMKR